MNATAIEWCDWTWNPVTGCSRTESPGCDNCYARRMAQRLRGRFGYPADEPFRPTFHRDRLDQPLRKRTPSTIFVCSMGDLFHPTVPDKDIAAAFGIMAACEQHRFLVLTKRPERVNRRLYRDAVGWPENVALGVSCSTQADVKRWVPPLLHTPAAMRFVSLEPLLGGVDLCHLPLTGGKFRNALSGRIYWAPGAAPLGPSLDWVIVGGETGPGARPMPSDWVRSVRDQAVAAGVPCFFKSWGAVAGVPFFFKSWGGTWRHLRRLDGRTHDDRPEAFFGKAEPAAR